jgi:hypothetical protein
MIKNYHDYFEELATKLLAISHNYLTHKRFARLEYGEDTISYQESLEIDNFCMLLGLPEFRVGDKLSDNVQEYQSVEMYIVKHCKADDFAGIRATQQAAKIIAYQIIAKIYKDKTQGIIGGFDRNTLTGTYCENVPTGNEYGIMLAFTLHHSINHEVYYRPTEWAV